MLKQLYISNFAIVPTLDLDFVSGFTAITGETGAGKSILVDALGLLLGERSDAAWVRPGAQRAELAAGFAIEHNEPARQWLMDAELEAEDGCLLRRTIDAGGRSRAYVNGSPVTVAQMQALGRLLVEVHGQNQHLRLARPSAQLRMLDDTGAHARELQDVQAAYDAWKQTLAQLQALEQESTDPATDLEFLEFQLAELDQHDLSIDGIEALQTEHDRLAGGEAMLHALNTVIDLLEPENDELRTGLNSGLNSTLAQLGDYASLDTDIDNACQMLGEATLNCSEALLSLRAARDRVNLDPADYERAATQLARLNELARKHRVRMDQLAETRTKLEDRIERSGHRGRLRKQLESELGDRLRAYREAAGRLHDKRRSQSRILAARVGELMTELGMAGGVFEILVEQQPQREPTVRGDDIAQVLISANPGVPPGPLQKIASGGELSRISLAIKVACIHEAEHLTQIFDEVDAGIGGETAIGVGQLLKRLSHGGQVLCVTHLAQVAVCADQQLQVSKASERSSTRVATRLLDEDSRVEEIARMLSGKLSDQSRAHALELLGTAR